MSERDQFNGKNWKLWWGMTEMILKGRGQYDIVMGRETCPDNLLDLDGYMRWQRLDNDARLQIIGTLDPQRREIALNAEPPTAQGVVDALRSHYRQNTTAAHHRLEMEFSNLKMKQHEDVGTFLERIVSLAHSMREFEMSVTNEQICTKMLVTLPPQWFHIVESLEDANITNPIELREKILARVARRKATESLYGVKERRGEVALMASNSNGKGKEKGRGKKDNRNTKCTACERMGHTSEVCYAEGGGWAHRKKPSWWTPPEKRPAEATQDTKRPDGQHTANAATTINPPKNPRRIQGALMAMIEDEGSDLWYIDSGASLHMTAQREMIANYHEIKPLKIQVANGSIIEAVGVGNVTITFDHDNQIYESVIREVHYVPEVTKNLLSLGALKLKGCRIEDSKEITLIRRPDNEIFLIGTMQGACTFVNGTIEIPPATANVAAEIDWDTVMAARVTEGDEALWHARLGHVNVKALRATEKCVEGLPKIQTRDEEREDHDCPSCEHAKSKRAPMPKKSHYKTDRKLQLVNSDLVGPFAIRSLGGGKYFMTFVDSHTSYGRVSVIRKKSEQPATLKVLRRRAETESGAKMDTLETDGGSEYVNGLVKRDLERHGIRHVATPPYTKEWNGTSERYGQTVMMTTRAIMWGTKLPKSLWGEAVATAAYLINRRPSAKQSGMTPYEAWFGRKPNISHLRIWGSKAYVHVPKERRPDIKLSDRATEALFVGYAEQEGNYRFYIPSQHRIVTSRDAVFHETVVGEKRDSAIDDDQGQAELSTNGLTEIAASSSSSDETIPSDNSDQESESETVATSTRAFENLPGHNNPPEYPPDLPELVSLEEEDFDDDDDDEIAPEPPIAPAPEPQPLRRSARTTQPRVRDDDPRFRIESRNPKGLMREERQAAQPAMSATAFSIPPELREPPQSYKEAMRRPDVEEWIRAMNDEIASLEGMDTWEVLPRPPHTRVLGGRWHFAYKYDEYGAIIRYKARYVAQGYKQIYNVDYTDTYSPVTVSTSIRAVLALAAHFDWPIQQFDVRTAFLNGKLEETIYIELPEGYKTPSSGNTVAHLKKGLYGLKQAGRAWNRTLDEELRKIGFVRCDSDPCVYVKNVDAKSTVILAIHVDDGLGIGSDNKTLDMELNNIARIFEITRSPAKFFLGMGIERDWDRRTISLTQTAYNQLIYAKFCPSKGKPVKTPLETGLHLQKLPEKSAEVQHTRDGIAYQSVTGSLNYAAISTRPDISYAVGVLSRFNAHPGPEHWRALDRVVRYVGATAEKGIVFNGKKPWEPVAFSDADWADDRDERKSTTGLTVTMCGGAVSWSSKRQQTPASSTQDAEYQSLNAASAEVAWLRSLLREIGISQTNSTRLMVNQENSAIANILHGLSIPTTIHCDNQAAISLTDGETHHRRAKHIDLHHHVVRHRVSAGIVRPEYIRTDDQHADILTKPLSYEKHEKHARALGIPIGVRTP
jgi:hypothetical protein